MLEAAQLCREKTKAKALGAETSSRYWQNLMKASSSGHETAGDEFKNKNIGRGDCLWVQE